MAKDSKIGWTNHTMEPSQRMHKGQSGMRQLLCRGPDQALGQELRCNTEAPQAA